MFPMPRSVIDPAPPWRRMLAGGVDAAIVGGAVWLSRRQSPGAHERASRWAPLFGPTSELVREQIGSPGQRLLGLRTVDRRTGRRLELWRTLVLLGASVGGRLLVGRLAPAPLTPERQRDRDGFLEELNAINQRHADDPAVREAERRALFERSHSPVAATFARAAGPTLAIGLLNSRLRRRLSPTIQVLARGSDDHSP
jgi:hypothetical protein